MSNTKLINEFLALEAMGEQMRQRAYRARLHLERLSAPAPSGVKRKKLSKDAEVKLVANFRKSLLKKASA